MFKFKFKFANNTENQFNQNNLKKQGVWLNEKTLTKDL